MTRTPHHHTVRRLTVLGLALAIVGLSVSPGLAVTTTYTDRTLWENAILALDPSAMFVNDPFDNDIGEADSITFDSGVISTNSPGRLLEDNSVLGGHYNNAVDGDGSVASRFIDWTFPMAILGFGADFSWLLGQAQISGNFDGTEDTTLTLDNGFWGVVGMNPFSAIRFSNPTTSAEVFDVDNLSFAKPSSTIPEPGTFLLLGTGRAGLAAWRARRGQQG